MSLNLEALTSNFVALASGVDISKPISSEDVEDIERAMDQYAVLIWRGCPLQEEQQLTLAKSFGEVEVSLLSQHRGSGGPANKSFVPISNVGSDGKLLERNERRMGSQVANQLWHSDSSFVQSVAKYSLLSAQQVPEVGGNTEFADLRAAYDALPQELQIAMEDLVGEHHSLHSRILLGLNYSEEEILKSSPSYWPLVRAHPVTTRKIIFVPVHIRAIEGMTDPEARLLVSELIEHSTQDTFKYSHKWANDDLVMWDNRCTLHRGKRYDLKSPRILRRVTITQ